MIVDLPGLGRLAACERALEVSRELAQKAVAFALAEREHERALAACVEASALMRTEVPPLPALGANFEAAIAAVQRTSHDLIERTNEAKETMRKLVRELEGAKP